MTWCAGCQLHVTTSRADADMDIQRAREAAREVWASVGDGTRVQVTIRGMRGERTLVGIIGERYARSSAPARVFLRDGDDDDMAILDVEVLEVIVLDESNTGND